MHMHHINCTAHTTRHTRLAYARSQRNRPVIDSEYISFVVYIMLGMCRTTRAKSLSQVYALRAPRAQQMHIINLNLIFFVPSFFLN